ncbi:uncharacterized protein LOC115879357 isoform X2 [Sitophilus oryzae]|uniref:Uncharacterized protein LOC115879357 isoform X2 n=1 Tax=Sitophilus oryzae TaxID=7048 RepID=A0A6J2XM97_SITOR|nr:uncharacterized protein LOC115879357 isoform X2 [Sitophilus oryzae]
MAESLRNKHQINSRRPKNIKETKENQTFCKRRLEKPEVGKNIIYVSNTTSNKALEEQCLKLVRNDEKNIIIYCLGAAVQRGILLALQISEKFISYELDAKTFSTVLIDDLEPTVDNADYEIQRRYNSALRIQVFKRDLLQA